MVLIAYSLCFCNFTALELYIYDFFYKIVKFCDFVFFEILEVLVTMLNIPLSYGYNISQLP